MTPFTNKTNCSDKFREFIAASVFKSFFINCSQNKHTLSAFKYLDNSVVFQKKLFIENITYELPEIFKHIRNYFYNYYCGIIKVRKGSMLTLLVILALEFTFPRTYN